MRDKEWLVSLTWWKSGCWRAGLVNEWLNWVSLSDGQREGPVAGNSSMIIYCLFTHGSGACCTGTSYGDYQNPLVYFTNLLNQMMIDVDSLAFNLFTGVPCVSWLGSPLATTPVNFDDGGRRPIGAKAVLFSAARNTRLLGQALRIDRLRGTRLRPWWVDCQVPGNESTTLLLDDNNFNSPTSIDHGTVFSINFGSVTHY